MYRVNLETGDLTLDTENPGDVLGWITDAKFQIRGAISMNPMDGSTTFRTRQSLDRYGSSLLDVPANASGCL